jgi:hypothetical protein
VDGCDDVVVKWGDLPVGIEPVENTHYTVLYQIEPPVVVLHTTVVDTSMGPDAVEFWDIGRLPDPMSPDPTHPLSRDLGIVTAVWLPPGNQNVEAVNVGGIVSPDLPHGAPVRNVSIVDIPAQSPDNWTSIRLVLEGDLLVRAQCYPNAAGAGGRISGTIDGSSSVIYGYAVGQEDDNPGEQKVESDARGVMSSRLVFEARATGFSMPTP